MAKVKLFFSKHLKLFVCVLSVLLLLGIVLFYFKTFVYSAKNQDITYNLFDSKGTAEQIPLENNSVFSQRQYIQAANFYGINILLNAQNKNSKGTIEVNFKGQNIDENWSLNVSDIKSAAPTYLKFKNEFKPSRDGDYVITLKAHDVEAGDVSVAAVIKTSDEIKSEATINGAAIASQLHASMVSGKRSILIAPFIIISAILILLVAAVAFLIIKRRVKFEVICTVIFAVIATMYMFVFTPFSIPDEPMHYISAVGMSNKMMGNFANDSKEMAIRGEDQFFYNNSSNLLSLGEYNKVSSNFNWTAQNTEKITTQLTPISNRELAYIFSGFGMTLGRIFNLGAYPTYYLGRFFNIIFMAICLYFSMKIMPFGKLVPFVFFMFPMTLHLSASFSYDPFTIGLSMILVAMILRMIYSKENVTTKNMIITAVIALFAIPYKVAYFTLAFLILLVPKNKFKSKFQNNLLKSVVCGVGLIGIIAVQFVKILSTAGGTASGSLNYYSISFILTHPVTTLTLIARTTGMNGSLYFESIFGKSLGWFQISIPSIFIYLYFALLLVAFIRKEHEPAALSFPKKCFVFILCLVSYCAVMILMMAGFTPAGTHYIMGVQGRYFLPIVPATFLIFRSNRITTNGTIDKYVIYGTTYLSVITLLAFFSLIIKV